MVLTAFICVGLFVGGVSTLVQLLFYALFPQYVPAGEHGDWIGVLAVGLTCIWFSGMGPNMLPAIGINGHLMIRVWGIRWVVVPWEDVREIVPVDLGWFRKGQGTIWLVVLRRAPTPWHYFFGLSYLRRNVPAFVITPSLQEYEKVLSSIEGHLQGGDHAA